MNFSPEIETALMRYKAFYASPQPGQLLVTVCPYTFYVPRPEGYVRRRLCDWHPFEDAERMAEASVAAERHFVNYTRSVESDYIPSVSPAYGIGLCSAFLSNMEVIPGNDTSWIHPAMEDLYDERRLRFDPSNPWIDFMQRYMRRAAELCDGDYCVATYGAMAPSDLANALRGNDLFYELYDDPDGVRRLLMRCVEATEAVYQLIHPLIVAPDDGFVAGGMWMPGEGLFLSEDCADICSPKSYASLYGPATQELVNRLGGAYIHHHAKGWAIHPLIARLENIRFIEFSWDPNCPRPVDHLDELLELSLKTPLQIRCTLADLRKYLPQMRQGRISVMVNVDTLDEAREAVRLVRKSSIL